MNKKEVFLLASLFILTSSAKAGNCPIIFIHGHKSNPTSEEGFKTWRNQHSAMNSILNEQYKSYNAGVPLECDKNSVLQSTGGETRKIYNFSYYNPDGSRGAIGTNGRLWPTNETQRWIYEQNINNACWAQHLSEFIDKVLAATGAAKVNIVAHSMGGLVAHSAIKYYGCADKVNKLLMIGTPNHGFDIAFWEFLYENFNQDQWWQWNGEDIEMNVGSENWYFRDTVTGAVDIWCNLMGYGNEGVHLATIAGNRKTGFGG